MGRFNIKNIYQGRIEEIDKQITEAVCKKQWERIKKLKDEKKKLQQEVSL